jgi:hypothetical protein
VSLTRLQQFAADLHQEVLAKAGDSSNPQFREDTFTELILELLNEHNEADGAEVAYHEKAGRGRIPASKLNAWALSGDGATLDLFVTLYHGTGREEAVGKAVVADYFKLLRGFLRRAREGFHTRLEESARDFRAAREIHDARDTLTTVRLFFLTDGCVRSGDIEQEQVEGLEVRYVLWDLEKLSRLHVGDREIIELDFAGQYGGAIPCLGMRDVTGEYRTFLAFLPASVLAQVYGEYGQRLLERNVRAFLQAKGKVNRGLLQTLRDEPHRFLAYNNGLCCTAANVRISDSGDGHAKLSWASDLQIVNGGQTTASIFNALRKEKIDISHVVVQVKLTVLSDPRKITEIVPLISKFANSQNKVNAADFSANGKFHQQLEQLSRTVWTPPQSGMDRGTHWYYERARGSYADDKAREVTLPRIRAWVEKNPLDRKFTKTDLAKYEHAWLGFPHLVCRGAEKNFIAFAERLEDDGEPEVDQDYFRHLIAKAILFRTAEKLYSRSGLEGYRANTVAYAIAWLAAHSGYRLNLTRMWDEQRVPPGTQEALGSVFRTAYLHLTRTSGNVGEWSKKTECWESFREQTISLDPAWEAELAESSYFIAQTGLDRVAAEWERVRHGFIEDTRTLSELEALSGLSWVASRRNDRACDYAGRTWEELRAKTRRLRNIRQFVEMFSNAAERSKTT